MAQCQTNIDFSIETTPIVCVVDALGRPTRARASQPGDLWVVPLSLTIRYSCATIRVMIRPDPAFNPTGDKEWFGVLTWVQPWAETQGNKSRMVGGSVSHPL